MLVVSSSSVAASREMGDTGAGKSTMISRLLGAGVTHVDGRLCKLQADSSIGPKIGHSRLRSETSGATCHRMPDGSILVDSCGFKDTRAAAMVSTSTW